MKMHKYSCKECKERPFYTDFAPFYEEEFAYCPNCGSCKEITYVGPVRIMELAAKKKVAV